MVKKIPVIIDCDPGHDDALMLMLAFGSGRFDVKAVTISAGNQTQEKTLNNALKILTLIGARVPVYRGAEKPMFRQLITADFVHGETGLDGPSLPKATFQAQPVTACEGMAEILTRATEKVTLVPTGPLTNIAIFLLAYPHLKNKVERISLMGGGIFRGNMTPLAEFNIFADPEAAAIVFSSGIPIAMCGLDVTHKALVFQKDIDALRKIGNKCAVAAADLMDFFSIFYRKHRSELDGGAALHDPCAIAWLINPDIFRTKSCYVAVETKGELTRGTTVVDFYDVLEMEPNAEVAYDIRRNEYIAMILDAVRNLP
ncbi:nucleoside hydrolase [Dyadobacter sediminis]|uniref:Pyrimidine-specific ribonucleoside hydrolase RihA n=1 Tax=Dyadobacter sediminis TaxID=1493691 RepID=A0A5R9KL12_9BACT|nr:nucleoside hydrolase [Dyadobacter sediminis]TLU96819.1 pyrimidine-specific ribonucleoside hydrolase RihA [Dyadobacter sediminis]GGB85401.1 pyrimidine-specific ribonucleoside hydrolase RihA [Dyadobacter sediminis]